MRYEIVTTYLLASLLASMIVIGIICEEILKSFQRINKSLLTYADCSAEIIDSAFIGEFKSFSECYLEKLNKTYFSCEYDNEKIICNVNNETKVFYLK